MTCLPKLSTHDLIALLSSRLCHDVISPVGAINNALELLEEADGGDLEIMDLIRLSASQACAKLQYARLTYGSGGSFQGQVALDSLRPIVEDYMISDKLTVIWPEQAYSFSKIEAKILLNLLLVAYASIPRGGEIALKIKKEGEQHQFYITVKGPRVQIMPKFEALQKGLLKAEDIDAYSIQPYYTLLLVEELQRHIKTESYDDHLIFVFS